MKNKYMIIDYDEYHILEGKSKAYEENLEVIKNRVLVTFEDYEKYKGEKGAKEAGKLRSEGKEYLMQDGDVCLFRFNN